MPKARFRLTEGMELSCSDDGSTVVCLGARVNVFDIRNRIRISSAHPFSHPSQAAFSPDGKLLAVKNTVGGIVVLDPATGNVIYDFKNQKEAEGSEVLFSPDGKKVIDASWQGEIRVRNMFEPTVVSQQSFHGEMISRISHDRARRIWLFEHHPIVRPGENWPSPPYLTLDKWPIGKRKAKVLSLDLDLLASSTLSPDAGRICFVSTRRRVGGWIKIAKASDGEVVATSEEIKIGGTGCELAWSSDGKYVGSVQARRFVFYHSSDLSVIGEVPCTYPSSICFLPGTEDVVLGSWNSSVLVEINDIAAGKVKMK